MSRGLILVGCGKMGGALLAGWLERGVDGGSIRIVDTAAATAEEVRSRHGVTVYDSPAEIDPAFAPDVVIFAVKPQNMEEMWPTYRRYVGGAVFLSIAAGKTIAYFQDRLGKDAAIVRSMPNTPAAVRRGITVACTNAHVSREQRQACHDLLEAVGEVAWTAEEAVLDAVTAVSGGGPAYVFLLVECLAEAAVEAGLPPELAQRLARATVAGAGELLRQSDDAPETLRRNVTSPGGTTAEALKVLMAADGWQPLLTRAIIAAAERSRQLAE